ncbi:hypothetical protein D5400_11765 [Georhizobium profundi]|uniref:Uncharacterized protein n=1 Tax=Georhizobium profundi TaxID=2341112 RepID=A0A3Q8XQQ7_9HYPH|nr:hypothetical protein D5400_11765 [Georhizobium profundi]
MGDGGRTYGPFDFEIFDEADVVVLVQPQGADGFTRSLDVSVDKTTDDALSPFTITFDEDQPDSTKYIVRAARVHERSVGVNKGSALSLDALEREFSKIAIVLQELRRDNDQTLRLPPGLGLPLIETPQNDRLTYWDTRLTGFPLLRNGPPVNEIGTGAQRPVLIDEDYEMTPFDGGVIFNYSAEAPATAFLPLGLPIGTERSFSNDNDTHDLIVQVGDGTIEPMDDTDDGRGIVLPQTTVKVAKVAANLWRQVPPMLGYEPASRVFFVPTFADLATAYIPADVMRLYVDHYEGTLANSGGWYAAADADPGHDMAAQNEIDGRWWVFDEPVLYLRQAGAKIDGVTDDSAAATRAWMTGLPTRQGPGTLLVDGAALQAKHPWSFHGDGPGKSTLKFKNMGGYAGLNGIELIVDTSDPTLLGSHTSFGNFTVWISGQNGKSFFKSPRAQAGVWLGVKPSYIADNIYWRGDSAGDAAYFELFTTAWECCLDLGEGCNHSVTRMTGGGNYDFRQQPTEEAVKCTFLRLGGNETGPGGVLTSHLSHWWLQHYGKSIDIGWRVIRGQWHCLAVHLGWWGVFSPNPRTGPNWGLDELEMSACNLNVQKGGIKFVGTTGGMTFDQVDVTRAAGGFDHGEDWVGVDVNGAVRLTLEGGRAYNAAVAGEYSGNHIGYQLANVENLMAGGQLIRANAANQLTTGMKIINPGKGVIRGLAVDGVLTDLIEFAGTPLGSGAAVGFTLMGVPRDAAEITGQRIKYSGSCTRQMVRDLDEPEAVDNSATMISATGSENYTPGVSPKWRRITLAAGTGPYVYDINMLATGARGGEPVEFTFAFLSPNGTVRILDANGVVQATITDPAGTSVAANTPFWSVRGRYLNTSPALFRVSSRKKFDGSN